MKDQLTLDRFHAGLMAGSGVAVRIPGLALFCPPGSSEEAVRRLIETVRSAGVAHGEGFGLRVARRLAGVLSGEEGDELPSFGLLADSGDRFVVFLYGPVAAAIEGDESLELTGASSATWLDRVIPATATAISLHPDGAALSAAAPGIFHLESGVVPAGAVVLTRHDRISGSPPPPPRPPTPPPPPPPPPTPPPRRAAAPVESQPKRAPEPVRDASFQSINLSDVGEVVSREPLPVEGAGEASEAEPGDEDDLVEGISCSRGHFNNPEGSFCSVCGISLVHQTHNLVTGRRPPLGFLVFDDGSTYSLDDSYVIGREPDDDERVRGGKARPLSIDDPERSISRIHAEITLVDWNVTLRDRGSTNGTYVWDASQQQWEPVSEGSDVVLQPASRVAVGQRTFVYETPHRGRL